MRRLVSRPEPMSVAWLWARRRAERIPDDEAMMVATGLAERIELEPLTREGLARLAAVRLSDTPPPALENDLWSKSGGHPGLAVDLLRRAVAAKAVVEDEAGMRVDEPALNKIGAPADYEESLLARCAALPPTTRALAEALAVWGAPLPADQVERLVPDASAETVESVIESGLASRLASGAIQLWPPLLAERLVATLDEEQRQRLHRQALGFSGLSRLQRFHHLQGAGDTRAALEEPNACSKQASTPKSANEPPSSLKRKAPTLQPIGTSARPSSSWRSDSSSPPRAI